MTEKQKIQLSKFYILLIGSLFILLIGLFVFASTTDTTFFIFLTLSLLVILSYLFPLRNRYERKKAEVELEIQDLYERANLLEAEMEQEETVIKSYRDKIVNYLQLKSLTEHLSLCLHLEDTSKTLSSEVNKLFGGKETTIILYVFHSKTGELGLSASQKGQMRVNIKAKKGDVFDQWIVKTMQPLLVEDTKSDFRFDIDKISTEDSRQIGSLISVPLMAGNKALGILRIDSLNENHFTTEDLRFLTTIGDLGAVAIENAQLYERAEQLAIKDGLTGLYLRRYLLDRMPEEISRQMRRKSQISFLMLDLDKFKQYNDKFGHTAGDILLRTLGTLLAEFFDEPGNFVCRYGGEEFAVLLPDCSKEKAVELAEGVRRKIAEQTIFLRRVKTSITVSIGVANFPKDARIKEELINKADQALYKAKDKGRNQVCAA